jgi:hypothetical protein
MISGYVMTENLRQLPKHRPSAGPWLQKKGFSTIIPGHARR